MKRRYLILPFLLLFTIISSGQCWFSTLRADIKSSEVTDNFLGFMKTDEAAYKAYQSVYELGVKTRTNTAALTLVKNLNTNSFNGLKSKLLQHLTEEQLITFAKDFPDINQLKKFNDNLELVDSWKVISNSPHSTDLDFIKFFDDVDVVSARNIVANNSAMLSKFPDMSVEELTAIYHYTTDAYYDLNRALRGLDPMTDQFDAFNKALAKSMDKLPKYSQPTYRGTVLPESILSKYKNAFDNGTNVVEDAFMSTSKDLDVAKSFADDVISGNQKKVFLEINGNSGVDIEDISAYGPSFDPSFSESEILFKSGSEFKVIGYSEEALSNGETYIKIILEQ